MIPCKSLTDSVTYKKKYWEVTRKDFKVGYERTTYNVKNHSKTE
jgi:hypothetical protein